MELERYWFGVTGSLRAVASRADQSDFGSPPVQAASSSFPTRQTLPMMGLVGFHSAEDEGLEFPVLVAPGVGEVVEEPLIVLDMSSRSCD